MIEEISEYAAVINKALEATNKILEGHSELFQLYTEKKM